MRSISVREHETSEWVLSAEELDDLLRTDLVKLTPGTNGAFGIRPGSVVGTAVFPHVRLHIEPKVQVRNLLVMLAHGFGLVDLGDRDFPYEITDSISAMLAWMYADRVEIALRRGVMRGYVEREEASAAPVGAIRFARQVAVRQSRPYPIECGFDEFTADIEINRLLRAAHARLLSRPDVLPNTQSQLRHQLDAFEGAGAVSFDPRSVPQPRFNRLTEHWRGAVELARVVLQGSTPSHREGELEAPAFTLDMNLLFERFVSVIVREEARKAGFSFIPQAPRPFTQNFGLRPDLLLAKDGTDVAVGDVKYKKPEDPNSRHADLYQMFAYCSTLGIKRGTLIYAGESKDVIQHVVGSKVAIELVGVDLSGSPADVLSSATRAAQCLVVSATAP